jgi:hypothetical protein
MTMCCYSWVQYTVEDLERIAKALNSSGRVPDQCLHRAEPMDKPPNPYKETQMKAKFMLALILAAMAVMPTACCVPSYQGGCYAL